MTAATGTAVAKNGNGSGAKFGAAFLSVALFIAGYFVSILKSDASHAAEISSVKADVDGLKEQQKNYRPSSELVSRDRFDATVAPMQSDIASIKSKMDENGRDLAEIKALLKRGR
jgi:hypothetical protein